MNILSCNFSTTVCQATASSVQYKIIHYLLLTGTFLPVSTPSYSFPQTPFFNKTQVIPAFGCKAYYRWNTLPPSYHFGKLMHLIIHGQF